jgi:hypothetical protein
MPTDEPDEPDDGSANVQNDVGDSSSEIRPSEIATNLDPAALIQRSEVQLNAILDQLKQELKPRGLIEQMYVEDLAYNIRDTRKLRETKGSIIRYEMQPALRSILEHVTAEPNYSKTIENDNLAKSLAAGWYSNKKDQNEVAKMLAKFNLDSKNIEAEAWRRASSDLDLIERQLTSLETRRDKALVNLANFRDGLAQRLKQKVNRIVEADGPFEPNASPNSDIPGEYSRLS